MPPVPSTELADTKARILSLEADIDLYRQLTMRLLDECRELTRTVIRLERAALKARP
jgi:hypothetical protein